jgi:phage shock protein C
MEAQEKKVALPLRSHTILGVCEAIGEDFGFNPIFLRIPFAAIVLYSPLMAIGAYLAFGVVVLAARLLAPAPKLVAQVQADAPVEEPITEPEEPEFAKAA